MWYVYILKSKVKDYIYVGSTNNLKRRIDEHNSGMCRSTAPHKPLILEAFVGVRTEEKARKLEKYFKTGSGKAILNKRILTDEALA